MTLMPMQRSEAETLAARVLAWIAADDDLTGAFLGATGAGPEDLRAAVADPEFLGFVLDFLMADEATLLACCDALAVPPDRPARARAGLPGGDLPHWT
jgi:hypothetical protein